MKDNLRTTIRAFIYCSLVYGICLGVALSIYSKTIMKGFAFGLLGGILFAALLSLYLLLGLVLFQKRWLFYSNMPEQLHNHNVRNVFYEGVAANTLSGRIKYGGLFLTHSSLLFIPHRFAIIRSLTEIPLKEIKQVKKTGINLLKFFSGGLRPRLNIETTTGGHYEFGVWNIDVWIKNIMSLKNGFREG